MARTWIWIGEGWELAVSSWPAFALLTLACFALMSLASHVSEGAFAIFLLGPVQAAALAVALHYARTRQFDWNRVQEVTPVFVPTMLVGILVAAFCLLGWVFLVVPGLVVMGLYLFPLLLVVDRKLPFWEAMEESRRKAQEDTVGFLGFVSALICVNLLGAACLGIGLALSLPVTWCAIAVAYRELWAEEPAQAPGRPEQPQLANGVCPTQS